MRKILRKMYLNQVPKKRRKPSRYMKINGQMVRIFTGTWQQWLAFTKNLSAFNASQGVTQ